MQAVGWYGQQDVALGNGGAVQYGVPLHHANGKARQVEAVLRVDARQLRRLPAYERAAHRPARLCYASYQGLLPFL